jgi:purine nucleosidase
MTPSRPVIFDTDIGTDVDDAMALALLLGTRDLDLLGITTVYGDTVLRARIARRYAQLAHRDVPVHAGIAEPTSGRDVWWAGHEGALHDDLARETVDPTPAVDFLVHAARTHAGKLDIIAVGPLTNIATAIGTDPAFAANVRTLWVMGGDFADGEAEHNFRSDATAARTVFDSAITTVVSGLDVTRRIRIEGDQLARLRAAGPIGAALGADIEQWWTYRNETWNVPHDPVTVLSLTRPDLFRLSEPGRIAVTTHSGEDDGTSAFAPTDGGTSRIVQDLEAELVAEGIIAGIVSAGSEPLTRRQPS